MAVVAPLELDELVPPGEAAGQPDGAHGRLGPGADHAHQVHGGDQFAHQIGHLGLQLRRGAEGQPEVDAVADGLDDIWVGVTQDHGAPGADVVDVAVAVGVEDIGPGRAGEEDRVAADAAEGPHRGVHAPGDVALGGGEEVVGAGHGAGPCSGVGFGLGFGFGWRRAGYRPRPRALGSGSAKTPLTTASRSAPAAIRAAPFCGVMPPMATRGRWKPRRARRSRSRSARTALGLVAEGKKLPKAT